MPLLPTSADIRMSTDEKGEDLPHVQRYRTPYSRRGKLLRSVDVKSPKTMIVPSRSALRAEMRLWYGSIRLTIKNLSLDISMVHILVINVIKPCHCRVVEAQEIRPALKFVDWPTSWLYLGQKPMLVLEGGQWMPDSF